MNSVAKWLVVPRRNPGATLRLHCFASAGHGPAMFRSWLPLLPPHIELAIAHLPGRESRWSEAPCTRIADVTEALATVITADTATTPSAFFGHSLGGLVAFEVARRLADSGSPSPTHLFVSAHRAPRLPNPHPRLSNLPDAQFIKEVGARHGGVPEEVASNRELMDLMVPSLRADYRVFEDYEYATKPLLAMPITAFGGTGDAHVTHDELAPWRAETTGPFALRMFEGGHFFVNDLRPTVVSTVLQTLQPRP